MRTVFLTNAAWHLTLTVIRSLGRRGVKVIAGDTAICKLKSRYCQRYTCYPDPRSENFVNALYNIINEMRSDVLIPMGNATIIPISMNKKLFEEITSVPIPDFDKVKTAYDKYESVRSASNIGIPVPETYLVRNEKEMERISQRIEYPAIIKPRESEGSAEGVMRINTPEEMRDVYKKLSMIYGDVVVQEYIPGGSEQMRMVNVLYDRNSEPVAIFTARKIREYPITGGITTFGESTWEPEIAEMGQKLFDAWKWYGVAEIEFKVDPRDGVPKLIEVNPRFWSYLQLPIYCGVDFPYLLYKVSLNERVRRVEKYKVGVKYVHPLKDILSVIGIMRSGRTIHVLRSYKGEKTYAILALDDPLATIGKILSDLEGIMRKEGRRKEGSIEGRR